MKRLIPALTIILLIIFPSICFSAYKIELKNGYIFVAESYWKENDLVKIIRYGGVIGLDPSLITGISWTDEVPEGAKGEESQNIKTTVVEPDEKMDEEEGSGLMELKSMQPPSAIE